MSIFDDVGQFLSDVWTAITDVFSPSPPAAPQGCPTHFKAKIVGVRFNSPILAARRGATVSGEHWTDGVDVNEPNGSDGSTKPAIVLIAGRGEAGVTIRIRVTRSENVSSTEPVTGYLGSLTIESSSPCPTSVGEHSVTAKITRLPSVIARDAGDATWSMVVDPIGPVSLGSTRLEVMTILDNPAPCFSSGIWIEALRAMCDLGVLGISQKRKAAATVARFCHAPIGIGAKPRYDTQRGASWFNAGLWGANGFRLAQYISPGAQKTVNCYDQAAAVTALAGALGVTLGWKGMEPFGFLAQTDLVGVGACNNPIFTGRDWNGVPYNPAPVVPTWDPHRSSFGRHAFVRFRTDANADVAGADPGVAEGCGDAMGGPAVFDATLSDYVLNAVDQAPPYQSRMIAFNQFQVIDTWENQQIAEINALTTLDPVIRDEALRVAHDTAEQARALVRAQLAAIEMGEVRDGVGVNSISFAAYSGP